MREEEAPLIVGICGRTCSGKTAITEAIASVNRNILLINMDIFFKNKTSCHFNGSECWEHTDCGSHASRCFKGCEDNLNLNNVVVLFNRWNLNSF